MPEPAADEDERDVGGVRFRGDFRPLEREFLADQFGPCRFRLLARSSLSADLALVEWEGAVPAAAGAPAPLLATPRRATYVVVTDRAVGAGAVPPRRGTAGAWPGMRLERVDRAADLAARFPGHFPGVAVHRDWRDRLRGALSDVRPALMLATATVWVLAVLWACRPFG